MDFVVIDLFGFAESQDRHHLFPAQLSAAWRGTGQQLVMVRELGCCAQERSLEGISPQESNGSPSAWVA